MPDKLYEQFLIKGGSSYLDTGKLQALGLPEINDSLLQTKIAPIARPIEALESIGSLTLDNSIIEIFLFLDRVNTYFTGLFEFTDKQFARIKSTFIRHGYFGDLYIAYGQGYVNAEIEILNLGRKHNKTKLLKADIFPNCKGRLYSAKGDENGDVTFTSLISGIEGHRFDPDNLVKAGFGGKGLGLDGFDVAKEGVAMNRMYVQYAKLATTKFKVEVSKAEDLIAELSDVLNGKFFFTQKSSGASNELEPEQFCDVTEPKEFMHGNMLYISQRMNTLGMVINPTNKAERMTTGEHYKDLKFSSCTESAMLSNLSGLCADLNQNFGTQINVYLTSSLQANGNPKTVDNPYKKFQNKGEDDDNDNGHNFRDQFK